MAGTSTPYLQLYKPDDADSVNVDTDLNANMDKIDDAVEAVTDVPACHVIMSSTKAIGTSSDVDIQWDSAYENWTPSGGNPMWSAAIDAYAIICRKSGLYDVGFSIIYASNATGKRVASITKNHTGTPDNASVFAYDKANPTAGDPAHLGDVSQVRMVPGDVLRVSTWQNSGSTLNVIGNTLEGKSRFWAKWVKP